MKKSILVLVLALVGCHPAKSSPSVGEQQDHFLKELSAKAYSVCLDGKPDTIQFRFLCACFADQVESNARHAGVYDMTSFFQKVDQIKLTDNQRQTCVQWAQFVK